MIHLIGVCRDASNYFLLLKNPIGGPEYKILTDKNTYLNIQKNLSAMNLGREIDSEKEKK